MVFFQLHGGRVNPSRTFKSASNSGANIYRATDLLVLVFTLFAAGVIYNVPIRQEYLTVLGVVLVAFLYTARNF